jgi:hypothetical protein
MPQQPPATTRPHVATLRPYGVQPFGLYTFGCPSCGDHGQRLIRATQHWRDGAQLCAQIHVTMDFWCRGCDRGWQITLFNLDESEGEILMEVKAVETVVQEDARTMGPEPAFPPRP